MENKKKAFACYLAVLAGALLLVGADQVTKYCAVTYLKGRSSIELIPGVFELSYLENRGAAFGIFENRQWMFIIGTILILFAALYVLLKLPREKHYAPFWIILTVVMSGAVGNLIDRIVNGYVVDFLYFSLIDFPVFNVADMYVTVGVAAFAIFYLIYPEDDFAFLFRKKNTR